MERAIRYDAAGNRTSKTNYLNGEVAAMALREGCGALRREVLAWNQPAIDFYKRLGARKSADWSFLYRGIAGAHIHLRGIVPGPATPRRAWIHSLYVEPAFRRRGIGRQLTETITAWCREQGFEWVYLHASEQGRPLYESLGFMPSSEMRLKL